MSFTCFQKKPFVRGNKTWESKLDAFPLKVLIYAEDKRKRHG